MLCFELLECLFARSFCIVVRLSFAQVCKYLREYLDANWSQLVASGHDQEWHEPEEWELEIAREADAFGDG